MDSIKCTASNGIEKAETNSGDIYLLINNSYLRFPPTVNSIDALNIVEFIFPPSFEVSPQSEIVQTFSDWMEIDV